GKKRLLVRRSRRVEVEDAGDAGDAKGAARLGTGRRRRARRRGAGGRLGGAAAAACRCGEGYGKQNAACFRARTTRVRTPGQPVPWAPAMHRLSSCPAG